MAIPAPPTNLRVLGGTQIDNLTEMITRRTRQGNGSKWSNPMDQYSNNVIYTENPSTYVFQPESLKFNDAVTGKETWVVARNPGTSWNSILYGLDHDINVWSYDGSILAFYDDANNELRARTSQVPTYGGWGAYRKTYLVHPDGSALRQFTGRGMEGGRTCGWPFANTENAAYTWSNIYKPDIDGDVERLWKITIDSSNVCTIANSGNPILDVFTASGGAQSKGFETRISIQTAVKYSISNDDEYLLDFGDGRVFDSKPESGTVVYINLNQGTSPTILGYWPLYRPHLNYWNGQTANQATKHQGSSRFIDMTTGRFVTQHESDGFAWWEFKCAGTDTDGGPLWEAWDGDSYGGNEVYPRSGTGGTNPPGSYVDYYGHPSFDRWGKWVLHASSPNGGKSIIDWQTGTGFDGTSYGYIDAAINPSHLNQGVSYSSWRGYCDAVVWEPGQADGTYNYMNYGLVSLINFSTYAITTEAVYFAGYYASGKGGGTVQGAGHPSQSPDGTKVAYQNYVLNSATSPTLTYAQWGVCYYPFPAQITGATKVSTNVRLAFDPKKYTTRVYPTGGASIPEPKEIKYWHVWYSTDKVTWAEATTTGVAFATRIYDYAQPNSSTYYYSITAEEHSRLESRRLGNIWKVITDGDGNITTQESDTAYPTLPGAISAFYTTAPSQPTGFAVTDEAIDGHFSLDWTEPSDSKVRYYNIYYATGGNPLATEAYRIASVPVGTATWLDWCAHTSAQPYYGITSVDRQGNESAIVTDTI